MKNIVLIIIFCLLFSSAVLAGDDFGLRLCLGTNQTGTASNYEFGAQMDYLVIHNLFMVMGATFLVPSSGSMEIAINSLGLEYNFPMGKNKLFLGTTLNRSYIKDRGGQGHKALSFHLGYKLRWLEWIDFVFFGGIIPKALLVNNPSATSGNGYFFRTALELYY